MERLFTACLGHDKCVNDGNYCRTCSRSNREIEAAREAVEHITEFLLKEQYRNPQDFLNFLSRRVLKKLKHREAELT